MIDRHPMKRNTMVIGALAVLSLVQGGFAGAAEMAAERSTQAESAEPKTLKERLSDKASDEQRVDNCGVPPGARGPKPRPGCPVEDAHASAGPQTDGSPRD